MLAFRQVKKLVFQVCSGELIHLVVGFFPVWEDLVCVNYNSEVGVPAATCEAVSLLQEERVLVSSCTAFVPPIFVFSLSAVVFCY